MGPAQAIRLRSDVPRVEWVVCVGCGAALCAFLLPFDELMHATDVAGWKWKDCRASCSDCASN